VVSGGKPFAKPRNQAKMSKIQLLGLLKRSIVKKAEK
jgi:hypothetical protein